MNKIEVVEKINEVLDDHCERPSAELRRLGEAMIKIADALEDQPILEARAIMQSVAALLGISKA